MIDDVSSNTISDDLILEVRSDEGWRPALRLSKKLFDECIAQRQHDDAMKMRVRHARTRVWRAYDTGM